MTPANNLDMVKFATRVYLLEFQFRANFVLKTSIWTGLYAAGSSDGLQGSHCYAIADVDTHSVGVQADSSATGRKRR